jgi:hypothetical protein
MRRPPLFLEWRGPAGESVRGPSGSPNAHLTFVWAGRQGPAQRNRSSIWCNSGGRPGSRKDSAEANIVWWISSRSMPACVSPQNSPICLVDSGGGGERACKAGRSQPVHPIVPIISARYRSRRASCAIPRRQRSQLGLTRSCLRWAIHSGKAAVSPTLNPLGTATLVLPLRAPALECAATQAAQAAATCTCAVRPAGVNAPDAQGRPAHRKPFLTRFVPSHWALFRVEPFAVDNNACHLTGSEKCSAVNTGGDLSLAKTAGRHDDDMGDAMSWSWWRSLAAASSTRCLVLCGRCSRNEKQDRINRPQHQDEAFLASRTPTGMRASPKAGGARRRQKRISTATASAEGTGSPRRTYTAKASSTALCWFERRQRPWQAPPDEFGGDQAPKKSGVSRVLCKIELCGTPT